MNTGALLIGLWSICIALFLWRWHRRVIVNFGILVNDSGGTYWLAEPTNRIPFRPGPEFRFGVTFHAPSGRRFTARVDHVLPGRPPRHSSDVEMNSIELEDGRFKIVCGEVEYPGAGCRALFSSDGDPLGWYEAHVFIDGSHRSVVRYEVVPDAV